MYRPKEFKKSPAQVIVVSIVQSHQRRNKKKRACVLPNRFECDVGKSFEVDASTVFVEKGPFFHVNVAKIQSDERSAIRLEFFEREQLAPKDWTVSTRDDIDFW